MILNLNENWEYVDNNISDKIWSGTVSIRVNGKEVKKANIWKRNISKALKLLKLYSDWIEIESGKNLIPIDLEKENNNYILNLKTKNYE